MTNEDVRAAAEFLKNKGIAGVGLSARRLAGAAEELGKSFSETLSVLADLLSDGQGRGMTQETEKAVAGD